MTSPIASDEPPSFLRWESLAGIAESRLVLSYQSFLVVTPLILTVVELIANGKPIHLPVTWAASYFAGLSFFLGMVIVFIRCPDVNRPSRNFEIFHSEGRTLQYILQQSRDTYLSHADYRPEKANHFIRAMLAHSEFIENVDEISPLLKANTDKTAYTRTELWQIVDRARMKPEALQELFWILHWFSNSTFPKSRLAAFVFFASGGVFVAVVMILQLQRILAAL